MALPVKLIMHCQMPHKKKACLLYFLLIFCTPVFAQSPPIDSLNRILANTGADTQKVQVLLQLSLYEQSFEQGLALAQQGLELAQKAGDAAGEADALIRIGGQYLFRSNYPIALYYCLQGLRKSEDIGHTAGIANATYNIGVIYKAQGDSARAKNYLQQGLATFPAGSVYRRACVSADLGDLFLNLEQLDSAEYHLLQSTRYFRQTADKYQYNIALNALGDLETLRGRKHLALDYFRQAAQNGIAYKDTLGLSDSYLKMAGLYNREKQPDSAIWYAGKALAYGQATAEWDNVVAAGQMLARLWENTNSQKALQYSKVALAGIQAQYDRQQSLEIENLSFAETQREKERVQRAQRDAADRRQNLQFSVLALGIVGFLGAFLLLSRRVITNPKVITALGIVALLIVFEFINLLLEPLLQSLTGNSPFLMLLAMVGVAALLAPLHHKLEHWALTKLVAKNRQLRMAKGRSQEQVQEDIG